MWPVEQCPRPIGCCGVTETGPAADRLITVQRFQRFGDDGWFRARQIEVTTSILLAIAATLSIVLGVISPRLFVGPFELVASSVQGGQLWRLFTWPFVNDPDIFVVLAIAMLYIVGGDIERQVGKHQFAWLIGTLIVVPAALGSAFPFVVTAGISSLVSPLFLIYVLWRPTARTFFDIPLWILVAVFEVLHLLQLLGSRAQFPIGGTLAFWAAGLISAALMARAFGITEFEQIPKIPLPAFVTRDPYQKANRARERSQRQHGGAAKPQGPRRRTNRGPATVTPIRPTGTLDSASQADMDALLDKISASGIGSLTSDERLRLDQHSRRLRGEQ